MTIVFIAQCFETHSLSIAAAPKLAVAVCPEGNPFSPELGRIFISLLPRSVLEICTPENIMMYRPMNSLCDPTSASHPKAARGSAICKLSPYFSTLWGVKIIMHANTAKITRDLLVILNLFNICDGMNILYFSFNLCTLSRVQMLHTQSVLLNEFTSRFDYITHQFGKDIVSLSQIIGGDLQKRARFRV
jgi:hypothetical protein